MRTIIVSILSLSILFLSGCRFSVIEAGFIEKKENQTIKVGAIATALMTDNALNEFIEFEEKQKREEDLKDNGIILGIFFERRF